MSDRLVQTVRQREALPPEEAALVTQAWGAAREVRAGEVLLRPGSVCRSLWFLDSGYARFYTETEDRDVTRHFAAPGTLFTVVPSLYGGVPAREGLQALTAARVRTISREAYERLTEASPAWAAFRQSYVREVYAYLDDSLDRARLLTASERYAAFRRDQPDVLLHVPLRYIASYLGMTPQSLSRVRAA